MVFLLVIASLVCQQILFASQPATTLGLIHRRAGAYEGYTLLDVLRYPKTYLIDINGFVVHTWDQERIPGKSAYLLENGHLLRAGAVDSALIKRFDAGGYGGILEEKDWDGNVVWHWEFWSETHMQHHDFELLPNGNILFIAWELKSLEEVIAAGRDTSLISRGELWSNMIIEVRRILPDSAEIVWEWHLWDHLIQDYDSTKENAGDVAAHPELMDLNFVVDWGSRGQGTPDWNHTNSVDYSPELDQVLLSLRHQGEIIVIDHGTTTEEAAVHEGGRYGHGGDILYRWGNPASYRAGSADDQVFFGQHDARWIDAEYPGGGNILVFNNGRRKPELECYSSVVEISPPLLENGLYEYRFGEPYAPVVPVWTYTAKRPGEFYSKYVCGAERLPNGNTFICSGWQGILLEVDADGNEVWEYVCPVTPDGPQAQYTRVERNHVFRSSRYGVDYPAFQGRNLTPGGTIEHYGGEVNHQAHVISALPVFVYRNPFTENADLLMTLPAPTVLSVSVFDNEGLRRFTMPTMSYPAGTSWLSITSDELPRGHYFVMVQAREK